MYQRLTSERFGFVLARFYHRQLPPSASLTTGLYPLAPRPGLVPGTNRRIPHELQDLILHSSYTSVCHRQLTGRRGPGHRRGGCQRPNGTRSRRAGRPYSVYHRNRQFFGQINPSLPARRRPTVDHSLVAVGAQRQGLQTCRPDAPAGWPYDAMPVLCLLSLISPEFAEAVRYGVPGTMVSPEPERHRCEPVPGCWFAGIGPRWSCDPG